MLKKLANRIWNLAKDFGRETSALFIRSANFATPLRPSARSFKIQFSKPVGSLRERKVLRPGRLPAKFIMEGLQQRASNREPVQIVASDCKLYKKNDICQQDSPFMVCFKSCVPGTMRCIECTRSAAFRTCGSDWRMRAKGSPLKEQCEHFLKNDPKSVLTSMKAERTFWVEDRFAATL